MLDAILQIEIRGGDEADVHRRRSIGADGLELARLQHAQQLRLKIERQVADLVEEAGAALREPEAAFLPPVGAGERPLLVAEQLGLEERLGDRAAVERDERLAPAVAQAMHGLRHELFSGSGLAESSSTVNVDAATAWTCRTICWTCGARAHLRREAAGGALAEVRAQLFELEPGSRCLERAAHDDDELLAGRRLGEVVEGAELGRAHRALDVAQPVQHDDRDVQDQRAQLGKHVEPAHVGEPKVKKNEDP